MKKRVFILFMLMLNMSPVLGFQVHIKSGSGVGEILNKLNSLSSYDTVIFQSGKYEINNLVISKPLTLVAEKGTVLDGKNRGEIITIKSSFVTLKGFTIQNSGKSDLREIAGIKLESVHDCVIEDNIAINNFFGIYLANSSNCLIKNNDVRGSAISETSSGNGVHLWKCNNIKIIQNHISGHRDGIYFEFATYCTIQNNLSEHNLRYGLHFMFSDHDSYSGNTFRQNGSGVAVMYTKYVVMEENTFEFNQGSASYGLLLKEISRSTISHNKFTSNTTGIFMEGSSNLQITYNTFRSNGWAIKLPGDCENDTISNNNFYSNTFDVSTNASSNLNCFTRNYWDHYQGYDLNRDKTGDIPFYPVSLFCKITEIIPWSVFLMNSFLVNLLDQAESMLPTISPSEYRDDNPRMRPVTL